MLCQEAGVRRPIGSGRARCRLHRLGGSALDGEHCGPAGGLPGPAGRSCRLLHCELCGSAEEDGSGVGWCSIGRWSVICGPCRPRVTAADQDPGVCGGGCPPDAAYTPRITSDGSWQCRRCSYRCGRTSVWLVRAWRLLPLALQWLGVPTARMPLAIQRRFCIERAEAWEAAAVAYSPKSAVAFPGDALEWADWRAPLADCLQAADVWPTEKLQDMRAAAWPPCLGRRLPVPADLRREAA